MGVETALIAGGVGLLGVGAMEQRKARKGAEKAANESTAMYESQAAEARKEKGLLNAKLDNSKKKLAVGMARSARRRSPGGIFGDSSQTSTNPLTSSLG